MVIFFVIELVLLLVMVEVVWDLESHTFTPTKLIFELMVVVFFHLVAVIIHPWAIPKNIDHLLCRLLLGSINLGLLFLVELVLILGQPTSPPREFIFQRQTL